jgi:hypothetical protein
MAIVAGYALYTGMISWNGPAGNIGGTGGNGVVNGQTQSVNKPIRINVFDKYGGGPLAGQTVSVYDSSLTQVDTLTTDSSGNDDTNAAHPTGEVLYFKIVGGDATHEIKWVRVTVPGQSPAEAQSLTVNPITLDMYDYTAPLMSVRFQNGTTAATGGVYNHTKTGDNAVFTVSWSQPTEGNGYMASADPVYGIQDGALLVMKLTGTGYDVVGVQGMSGGIERASARYFYAPIDDQTLSKWKVGNTYKYPGTGSQNIDLTFTGVTGDALDVDFYIYYFADWNYFVQQGNFGPNAVSVVASSPFVVNISGYP